MLVGQINAEARMQYEEFIHWKDVFLFGNTE